MPGRVTFLNSHADEYPAEKEASVAQRVAAGVKSTAGTGSAVTTWSYDDRRGWLTGKKYEGRRTSVEYEYTPAGRLKLRRWERKASSGGRLVTTYRHGIPAESALGLPADGGLHRIEYGALVAGQQYGYLYDDVGNSKESKEGGDATGTGLQTTSYTANPLNQCSSIATPGLASLNGLANATNGVTVNAVATVRQGKCWWKSRRF